MSFHQRPQPRISHWAPEIRHGLEPIFRLGGGLEKFNHSVGQAAAMQAGTKGNFTHFSGIPSRFASLHDVPCLLPPSAGFAWVSTCSHQLVTQRLVSSRCKLVKREFISRTAICMEVLQPIFQRSNFSPVMVVMCESPSADGEVIRWPHLTKR